MYSFYVTIHARPADAPPGPTMPIEGQAFASLAVPATDLAATLMDCSFETAIERLARLDRMYCEPDGSFVWVSSQHDPTWQVDGNLYDRQQRLHFVDLKGSCPREAFDQLLAALGWPAQRLIFQLTRQAILLEEAEFRRHAERARS
jgi:hypothetical protein